MFIRKRKYNKPLASILLAVFVFSGVVAQSSALLSNFKLYGVVLAKAKGSTPSNVQFPFEKKENEEKKSSEEKSPLGSLLIGSILFSLTETIEYSCYTDPYSCGKTAHVPLYLFFRTLLIWSILANISSSRTIPF